MLQSGGTIASVLDMSSMVWAGGKALMKKLSSPVLLAAQKADGSAAFKNPSGPGGLGYDSVEKCETNKTIVFHICCFIFRFHSPSLLTATFEAKKVTK